MNELTDAERIAGLKSALRAAGAALMTYGDHLKSCAGRLKPLSTGGYAPPQACDCGLRHALDDLSMWTR